MAKKKNIWLGILFIIIGIILCFVPILPGWVFLVIGGSYLGFKITHKEKK